MKKIFINLGSDPFALFIYLILYLFAVLLLWIITKDIVFAIFMAIICILFPISRGSK
jgi:hypothetical protein